MSVATSIGTGASTFIPPAPCPIFQPHNNTIPPGYTDLLESNPILTNTCSGGAAAPTAFSSLYMIESQPSMSYIRQQTVPPMQLQQMHHVSGGDTCNLPNVDVLEQIPAALNSTVNSTLTTNAIDSRQFETHGLGSVGILNEDDSRINDDDVDDDDDGESLMLNDDDVLVDDDGEVVDIDDEDDVDDDDDDANDLDVVDGDVDNRSPCVRHCCDPLQYYVASAWVFFMDRFAPMRSFIHELLSPWILASWTFVLMLLSGTVTMVGQLIPFLLLPDLLAELNWTSVDSRFALSVIGVGNTIGRLIATWSSTYRWADCLWLNNGSLFITSLCVLLMPLLRTYYGVFILVCAVFGLSSAVFVSLKSILVVELLGLDRLTNSFGYMLLFQGVAASVGPPVAAPSANVAAGPVDHYPSTTSNTYEAFQQIEPALQIHMTGAGGYGDSTWHPALGQEQSSIIHPVAYMADSQVNAAIIIPDEDTLDISGHSVPGQPPVSIHGSVIPLGSLAAEQPVFVSTAGPIPSTVIVGTVDPGTPGAILVGGSTGPPMTMEIGGQPCILATISETLSRGTPSVDLTLKPSLSTVVGTGAAIVSTAGVNESFIPVPLVPQVVGGVPDASGIYDAYHAALVLPSAGGSAVPCTVDFVTPVSAAIAAGSGPTVEVVEVSEEPGLEPVAEEEEEDFEYTDDDEDTRPSHNLSVLEALPVVHSGSSESRLPVSSSSMRDSASTGEGEAILTSGRSDEGANGSAESNTPNPRPQWKRRRRKRSTPLFQGDISPPIQPIVTTPVLSNVSLSAQVDPSKGNATEPS